jgi:MoxR-like ATPase
LVVQTIAGCGKTSFVAAMAAKLGFSVCVLNLSEKNLNDSSLNMVRRLWRAMAR